MLGSRRAALPQPTNRAPRKENADQNLIRPALTGYDRRFLTDWRLSEDTRARGKVKAPLGDSS